MANTKEITWTAQPKQRIFLIRQEDEVLFGGSAGPGKSDALLAFLIRRAVKYSGSKGLFLRRNFSDMSKAGSAIDRSKELLTGVANWDTQLHRWTFANKSIVEFGFLDRDEDRFKYHGAQYDSIVFDESTQFSLLQFLYLMSRCRATIDGIKPLIRLATNPGNIGHAWHKARYVTPAPPMTTFNIPLEEGQKLQRTGCFVPGLLQDNQILMNRDPGYWDRLMSLPEDEKRALAYGDWDVFMGQIFVEFRREKHICEPFSIPPDWPRWVSYDYGYNAPACVLWFAKGPDERVYVYKELYVKGLTDVQQGERIRSMSKDEKIMAVVGDPSCFSTQPNGTTIAENLRIGLMRANNDRMAGLQRVHEYLSWDDEHKPKLQILPVCLNLIRTLPEMIYDERKIEDANSNTEDHAYDALRYGIMGVSTGIKRKKIIKRKFQYAQ